MTPPSEWPTRSTLLEPVFSDTSRMKSESVFEDSRMLVRPPMKGARSLWFPYMVEKVQYPLSLRSCWKRLRSTSGFERRAWMMMTGLG